MTQPGKAFGADFLARLVDRAMERSISLTPRLPGLFDPLSADLSTEPGALDVPDSRAVSEGEDQHGSSAAGYDIGPTPGISEIRRALLTTRARQPLFREADAAQRSSLEKAPRVATTSNDRGPGVENAVLEKATDELLSRLMSGDVHRDTPKAEPVLRATPIQGKAFSDAAPKDVELRLALRQLTADRETTPGSAVAVHEENPKGRRRSNRSTAFTSLDNSPPGKGTLIPNGPIARLSQPGFNGARESDRFGAESKAAEPRINISIGRIEIRGTAQAAPKSVRNDNRRQPLLSLEDYLKQRGGRT